MNNEKSLNVMAGLVVGTEPTAGTSLGSQASLSAQFVGPTDRL